MQRLRQALTDRGASTEDLRLAIASASVLIEEAQRELSNKQLRERRAAFQELHDAMGAKGVDAETILAQALARARGAKIDDEDVEKAEVRLAELRSMSSEQRAAKAARLLEAERKKEAFMLVKRDDAEALEAFLGGLEDGVRWSEWKDYAGRSVWRCSKELRATRVQQFLRPVLGLQVPDERLPPPPASPATATHAPKPSAEIVLAAQLRTDAGSVPHAALTEAAPDLPVLAAGVVAVETHVTVEVPAVVPVVVAAPTTTDGAELKTQAMRAVVKNDPEALAAVIKAVPQETWSCWRNKAGTDLLTLAEERGSSLAYSVLAAALGILKEMHTESFEDRETVWVFEMGDVQPRRATVIEGTQDGDDTVLLEYWDGNAEPERAKRCSVRKAG